MMQKVQDNLKSFLEVRNATETTADLYFYGDIVSSWWGAWDDTDQYPESVRDFLLEHQNKALNIHINSGGGSVFAGITIYNMLKHHTGEKTVYIDGVAASIASVIALAGDKVVMGTGTTFMIHKPWARITGNSSEMRECADWLDKIQECIMQVYQENLKDGADFETVKAMVDKETWLTAEEAAEYFNIELDTTLEAVACMSDYFKEYEMTPKSLTDKKDEPNNEEEIEKLRLQLQLM